MAGIEADRLFPEANEQLRRSIEVDLSPKNKPDNVDKIDGALGENSPFHQPHGFYVHGVSLKTAALPQGWKERTNEIQDYMDESKIGWCIETHDLAASKLIAFREKDTQFVRRLILEDMIEIEDLLNRLQLIKTDKELKQRAKNWVERIADEMSS